MRAWIRIRQYLGEEFDSEWKALWFLSALGTVAFFLPLTILFVVGQLLPAGLGWVSSVIIILVGIATFFSDLRLDSVGAALLRIIIITGSLFLIELAGVTTGFPFGEYAYTEELGLFVAGVPIAIAFAWYSTVINSWRIADQIAVRFRRQTTIVVALIAGVFTVGLDVALEPMASSVEKYWLWQGSNVPIQNYVSWFVLSTLAVYLLARTRGKDRKRVCNATFYTALFLFGFHFVLSFLVDVVNGHVLVSAISLVIVLSPFVFLLQAHAGYSHAAGVEQ